MLQPLEPGWRGGRWGSARHDVSTAFGGGSLGYPPPFCFPQLSATASITVGGGGYGKGAATWSTRRCPPSTRFGAHVGPSQASSSPDCCVVGSICTGRRWGKERFATVIHKSWNTLARRRTKRAFLATSPTEATEARILSKTSENNTTCSGNILIQHTSDDQMQNPSMWANLHLKSKHRQQQKQESGRFPWLWRRQSTLMANRGCVRPGSHAPVQINELFISWKQKDAGDTHKRPSSTSGD